MFSDLETWHGTLPQLLWFDGLPRKHKNHICAAIATGEYELKWDPKGLRGVLVRV